jgi:hypothetical protein
LIAKSMNVPKTNGYIKLYPHLRNIQKTTH